MAAPLLPLLKKAAVALVTDKRVRKIIVGIVLGVIFLAVLPIIAMLGANVVDEAIYHDEDACPKQSM